MTKASATLQLETVRSPIGDLLFAAAGDAVRAVAFEGGEADTERYLARRYGGYAKVRGRVPARLRAALDRYFEGDMVAFEGIETAARGTAFQEHVWGELRKIPAGRTASYADIAQRIGQPSAVRAVGLANGRNPVPIIIPCPGSSATRSR